MFYDVTHFPFTKELEANWTVIRDEYQALDPKQLLKAPWEDLYNKSWDIYTLFAKEHKFKLHCAQLPQTTALIELIPGLYNAGFSVLGPHSHIKPHVGYTHDVLRCHLGLIVPPDCAIRVDQTTRAWQEGKCLIFDDMFEHEAWNHSDASRVILILDLLKQG